MDGSFCDYEKADKDDFLKQLYDIGVRNMEMESAGVLAMALRVGIKAAVVCSVIVDRLKSDRPTITMEESSEAQNNSIKLIGRYIKQKLSN
uniref:Nucleoside phosphorylase domain-containing protein n=1 Tax=Arion vulgaris TaxID=1028688 RepID=A0A0B7B5N8_9EUPU